jgi:hypothetical protein
VSEDSFDDVFGDLASFARKPGAPVGLPAEAFGALGSAEEGEGGGDEDADLDDEVIVGEEYVTYLVYSARSGLERLSVVVLEDALEVTGGGRTLRRALGARVLDEDGRADLRNGVLSLRLRRVAERDGSPGGGGA